MASCRHLLLLRDTSSSNFLPVLSRAHAEGQIPHSRLAVKMIDDSKMDANCCCFLTRRPQFRTGIAVEMQPKRMGIADRVVESSVSNFQTCLLTHHRVTEVCVVIQFSIASPMAYGQQCPIQPLLV